MNCDILFGKWKGGKGRLDIIEEEFTCDICANCVSHKIAFPTGCGHYMCVECLQNIIWYKESRFYLDPRDFGCPAGNTCECEEDECDCNEIIDKWRKDYPDQADAYTKAEDENIANGLATNGICPFCGSDNDVIGKDRRGEEENKEAIKKKDKGRSESIKTTDQGR